MLGSVCSDPPVAVWSVLTLCLRSLVSRPFSWGVFHEFVDAPRSRGLHRIEMRTPVIFATFLIFSAAPTVRDNVRSRFANVERFQLAKGAGTRLQSSFAKLEDVYAG